MIFLNIRFRISLFFLEVLRVSCFLSSFGDGFLGFFFIILLVSVFVIFEFVSLFLFSMFLLEFVIGRFWFENVLVCEVIVFFKIEEIKLFLEELFVLVFDEG